MASTASLETLLSSLTTKAKTFSHGDETSRRQLLEITRTLFYKLETPMEALFRICWVEPVNYPVIRTGIATNLFEKMNEKGGNKGLEELAAKTGVDEVLLSRILKHLASIGIIYETEVDEYASTPLSNLLIEPKLADGFKMIGDTAGPPLRNLPLFLAETNFQNPSKPSDSPFQYGHKTSKAFFPWFHDHPDHLKAFNNFMAGHREGRPSWTEYYPVKDRLLEGVEENGEGVILADIGGGMGQDLEIFARKFPDFNGTMVLQDQAAAVDEAKGKFDERFKLMAHNFFDEQPVKGARAYYLHNVLHDWTDDKCIEILTPVRGAMRKGYSTLLINERVIPNKGASSVSTGLDFLMMICFSGAERTERQWQELVRKAGFKWINLWTTGPDEESLIEAELA